MPPQHKQDNSTLRLKVQLRRNALREISDPVVMETHGGWGRIFECCYRQLPTGVVFEKLPEKAARLAAQRPTWAVYEADVVRALASGVGAHLPVNFLDLDPYGEPWPAIAAFFSSARPFAPRLALVVNDGLRQKLRMNGGWHVASLERAVARRGNAALYRDYLDVCRELVAEQAAKAGYAIKRWAGYYCGAHQNMTHYAAVLER